MVPQVPTLGGGRDPACPGNASPSVIDFWNFVGGKEVLDEARHAPLSAAHAG
jgi:hypothetical protein